MVADLANPIVFSAVDCEQYVAHRACFMKGSPTEITVRWQIPVCSILEYIPKGDSFIINALKTFFFFDCYCNDVDVMAELQQHGNDY